jgi:hypothetical protein
MSSWSAISPLALKGLGTSASCEERYDCDQKGKKMHTWCITDNILGQALEPYEFPFLCNFFLVAI